MSKELYDKIRRVLELADSVIALQEPGQHWLVKGGVVITSSVLREEIQNALKAWDAENAKNEERSRLASTPGPWPLKQS